MAVTVTNELTLAEQQRLVEALLDADRYPHPTGEITLIQTHISWVILTGEYVYKLKKVVDFGFLNYSTREKRAANVAAELRLNRRTAPALYLEQVAIGGSADAPRLGDGSPIDYALKMRQFPQSALLKAMTDRGELSETQVTDLATAIAHFHTALAPSRPETPYGRPEQVVGPMRDNLATIRPHLHSTIDNRRLEAIADATERDYRRLQPLLTTRHDGGAIRECHGDLHLGNIAWLDGSPLLFDCIEFNPELRFIDTLSELAFTLMDLDHSGHPEFANRLLNDYLSETGDYGGVPLLRFYQRYRAMVRAKIAILDQRRHPEDSAERQEAEGRFQQQLALAEQYGESRTPRLLITRGLSGSGKSTLARQLATHLGAIHIRSDVERKRLFRLNRLSKSGSAVEEGIYSSAATAATYRQLLTLAEQILRADQTVIIDATFLKQDQRAPFIELANRLGCPFRILDIVVPTATLEERIAARRAEANDPSEADIAVLHHQLRSYAPIDGDERAVTLVVPNGVGDAPINTLIAEFTE